MKTRNFIRTEFKQAHH